MADEQQQEQQKKGSGFLTASFLKNEAFARRSEGLGNLNKMMNTFTSKNVQELQKITKQLTKLNLNFEMQRKTASSRKDFLRREDPSKKLIKHVDDLEGLIREQNKMRKAATGALKWLRGFAVSGFISWLLFGDKAPIVKLIKGFGEFVKESGSGLLHTILTGDYSGIKRGFQHIKNIGGGLWRFLTTGKPDRLASDWNLLKQSVPKKGVMGFLFHGQDAKGATARSLNAFYNSIRLPGGLFQGLVFGKWDLLKESWEGLKNVVPGGAWGAGGVVASVLFGIPIAKGIIGGAVKGLTTTITQALSQAAVNMATGTGGASLISPMKLLTPFLAKGVLASVAGVALPVIGMAVAGYFAHKHIMKEEKARLAYERGEYEIRDAETGQVMHEYGKPIYTEGPAAEAYKKRKQLEAEQRFAKGQQRTAELADIQTEEQALEYAQRHGIEITPIQPGGKRPDMASILTVKSSPSTYTSPFGTPTKKDPLMWAPGVMKSKDSVNLDGLDSNTKKALKAAGHEYFKKTGGQKAFVVTSGFRTKAKQQELYDKFVNNQSRYPAAKPGSSRHEIGRAIDLVIEGPAAPNAAGYSILNRHGFNRPLTFRDPIHFEHAEGDANLPQSRIAPQANVDTNKPLDLSDETIKQLAESMSGSMKGAFPQNNQSFVLDTSMRG